MRNVTILNHLLLRKYIYKMQSKSTVFTETLYKYMLQQNENMHMYISEIHIMSVPCQPLGPAQRRI